MLIINCKICAICLHANARLMKWVAESANWASGSPGKAIEFIRQDLTASNKTALGVSCV